MIIDFPKKPPESASKKYEPTAEKMMAISSAIYESMTLLLAAQGHLDWAMAHLVKVGELRYSNICALLAQDINKIRSEKHAGFSLQEIAVFCDELATNCAAIEEGSSPDKPDPA